MSLRQRIVEAIDESTGKLTLPEVQAMADAVMAVVDPALWRANNLIRGNCRYCGGHISAGKPHKMYCRNYVGRIEHRWMGIRPNGTFGGLDYDCVCGDSIRVGGIAGVDTDRPRCPSFDKTWKGPEPKGVVAGQVT